jgi:hypothetical protein
LTNTQRQKFGLFWSRSILKSFHWKYNISAMKIFIG